MEKTHYTAPCTISIKESKKTSKMVHMLSLIYEISKFEISKFETTKSQKF